MGDAQRRADSDAWWPMSNHPESTNPRPAFGPLAALLLTAIVSLFTWSCSSSDDSDPDTSVGLCYLIQGSSLRTECAGSNRNRACAVSPGFTWYGDYTSHMSCGDASRKLLADWKAGIAPKAPGGGGGGGGTGDCVTSCPSEVSDVQLDTFCRQACCLSVTGQTSQAADTCRAGASLGTSSCRYCR